MNGEDADRANGRAWLFGCVWVAADAAWRSILPPGGTKALVDKTCGTGCHPVEVVTSQRMNAADWNAVVQNMVARGAQASEADVKAIVDYLSKTLGR